MMEKKIQTQKDNGHIIEENTHTERQQKGHDEREDADTEMAYDEEKMQTQKDSQ